MNKIVKPVSEDLLIRANAAAANGPRGYENAMISMIKALSNEANRRPSPLLIWMHPLVRRDLLRRCQLDHVHRRRVAALPAKPDRRSGIARSSATPARSASRAASVARCPALIFAPRIWLPQMTSRDLVPMAGHYSGQG
jgi:hypothetical protein